MAGSYSLKSVNDSPANVLRRLASRAYRMLRQDRSVSRNEVIALLNEIDRVRRVFDPITHPDLVSWFDRLEDQVAALLDGSDPDAMRPRLEPSNFQELGVA